MAGRVVDSELVGDRFFVRVVLPDGTLVRMLADTGGGYHVDPDVVSSLPRVPAPHWGDGAEGVELSLDPPTSTSSLARLMPTRSDADGVVDAWWFCGRVWAFDYRQGRLEIDVDPPTIGVPLGFLRGADGRLLAPSPASQHESTVTTSTCCWTPVPRWS